MSQDEDKDLDQLFAEKHTTGVSDREKLVMDALVKSELLAFAQQCQVKESKKKAGSESARVRKEHSDILREEWLAVAKRERKINPRSTISEIAKRIQQHMLDQESEFDFDVRRELGTIRNYLQRKL